VEQRGGCAFRRGAGAARLHVATAGRDASLVLHGGGNTSVKLREPNVLGEAQDLLYVKGSGWDLATIREPGFVPVQLQHLLKLATLETLSDPQMVSELATHVVRAGAPAPSVETILHAILPYGTWTIPMPTHCSRSRTPPMVSAAFARSMAMRWY